ncbi:hypothetical protein AMAG_13297 [Allomyces macrogynus ATCC 38327]|uniref:Pentatricopeptide repeat domain-containing protein n=1 Tax=Allomyces macrogynus (strain ATCC 38327) TaxID=578462 RepID=A0A0L0T049_ALLM3|nr:hypothetical protein AMAG_13297 [Allomyces macrogynus ATCC 38327]|eukprot:KNE68127.1 hypothetical protein AMAG_13297 [Allomyces macrogynus ATCC 38327]
MTPLAASAESRAHAVELIPFDQLVLTPPSFSECGPRDLSRPITSHGQGLREVAHSIRITPTLKDDSRRAWTDMIVTLVTGLARTKGMPELVQSDSHIFVGRFAYTIAARRATAALEALQQLADMAVPVMHKVSPGTLEALVMAYVRAGGVQRLLDVEGIYGALVASGMSTKRICSMAAGLLADAVGRADAPVGERWGEDRVAAIRTVMDDAVELGFLSSRYADVFVNGALIRAMTWQHGPLVAMNMVKAMVDQGANIDMRALSSLTTKLMDARCFDELQALSTLVEGQREQFPLNLVVKQLFNAGDYQAALELVGLRLEKVAPAERDWRLYEAHFETLTTLGQVQLVFDLHDEVVQSQIPLGSKYYTTLVKITTTLGLSGLHRALDYVEEMLALSLPLDSRTLTKVQREIALHDDALAKARLDSILAARGLADGGPQFDRQLADQVGPLLFSVRRSAAVNPGQTLQSARAILETLTNDPKCPPNLGFRWWSLYMDALTYVWKEQPGHLFAELRVAHQHHLRDPARHSWVQHHVPESSLTLLVKALGYARRLDLVLALWDEYVLRVPPRNDSLVVDPVWRFGSLETALVPSDPLQCIVVDAIGLHGDLATLLDVESVLLRHLIDDRKWPAATNTFTSLIEAHFRLKNPDGARRILLHELPRAGIDSDAKLRQTFQTRARLDGFPEVVSDPMVLAALDFGPWPKKK